MKRSVLLFFSLCMLSLTFVRVNASLSTSFQELPNTELHQFDENFKDSYASDRYNYEGMTLKEKERARLAEEEKNRKRSKYSKDKPTEKQFEEADRERSSSTQITLPNFLTPLIFIIGGAVLVFLVYTIVGQGNVQLFGRSGDTRIDGEDDTISAENITQTDIDSLIAKAENEGNFRLATRYLYLLVLKQLTIKKHIVFEDEKTNSDYLFELNHKTLNPPFRKVSYLYNYIWYGEFAVNDMEYQKVKGNFSNLLNSIGR